MQNNAQPFSLPSRDQVNMLLSAPLIYGMIIPVALLHVSMLIYQAVCFPVYGIAPVDSKKYIKDVRMNLPYLTFTQRLNCWYCSYAKEEFDLAHRKDFAEYGDPEALQEYQKNNRTLL